MAAVEYSSTMSVQDGMHIFHHISLVIMGRYRSCCTMVKTSLDINTEIWIQWSVDLGFFGSL